MKLKTLLGLFVCLMQRYNTWLNTATLDRPLYALFWQRLLSAGVRVANADEADFFYVPVKLRVSADSQLVHKALDYIITTWPHWNSTGGARHLFMHTGTNN